MHNRSKTFRSCREALDFIDKLATKKHKGKKIRGNIHAEQCSKKVQWRVTWKGTIE